MLCEEHSLRSNKPCTYFYFVVRDTVNCRPWEPMCEPCSYEEDMAASCASRLAWSKRKPGTLHLSAVLMLVLLNVVILAKLTTLLAPWSKRKPGTLHLSAVLMLVLL
jgi:hypothetical protein